MYIHYINHGDAAMNTDHLIAIHNRLFNEKARYALDNNPIRAVWIAGIEKEMRDEMEFIGLPTMDEIMEDEDLLAMLA